jgi:hypothetical protein
MQNTNRNHAGQVLTPEALKSVSGGHRSKVSPNKGSVSNNKGSVGKGGGGHQGAIDGKHGR